MLKILTAPNKVLEEPVKKVKKIDDSIAKMVRDMEKVLMTQDDPPGVGLAANQVGIDLAIFIVKPTPKAKTEVFINPKLIQVDRTRLNNKGKQPLEGCLSLPRIWGQVERAPKVLLEYQNLRGKIAKKTFSGFRAIIIQHEMDHLNGILFTKRVLEQKLELYEEKAGKLVKMEY